MIKSLRPKTAEGYAQLVDQAVVEVEELIACFEYEMDDAGERTRQIDPLLNSLKSLRSTMVDGSYRFGNQDLPFMALSNRMSAQLPFNQLLYVINETHRFGLNVEEE